MGVVGLTDRRGRQQNLAWQQLIWEGGEEQGDWQLEGQPSWCKQLGTHHREDTKQEYKGLNRCTN